ncbi:MAG: hypothetical protein ACPIOQ_09390 [Promethearchaeia archaeon]
MAGGYWDRGLVKELVQPLLQNEWIHFRPDDEQNDFKIVLGVCSPPHLVLSPSVHYVASANALAKSV